MHIDIYSDTICPWCYIGKKRLQRALSARPELDVTVNWHAFQLNPWMPTAGVPREEYLRAKFGASDADRIYANIREVGMTEGIDFRFDLMERTPNTIRSHRLIAWAGEQGPVAQDAMVEALFQVYFLEGHDLSATAILLDAVSRAGLDVEVAEAFLATDLHQDMVVQEDAYARRMGIQGVPCFIVDGSYAVSGAQEPEYFFPLFDLVTTKQAAAE